MLLFANKAGAQLDSIYYNGEKIAVRTEFEQFGKDTILYNGKSYVVYKRNYKPLYIYTRDTIIKKGKPFYNMYHDTISIHDTINVFLTKRDTIETKMEPFKRTIRDTIVVHDTIPIHDTTMVHIKVLIPSPIPDTITYSGIKKETADSILAIIDTITINEDMNISSRYKNSIQFEMRMNSSNQIEIKSNFPSNRGEEIICLIAFEINGNQKKVIGFFNNGGSIILPYNKNIDGIRICSFVNGKKEQAFSFSKKL